MRRVVLSCLAITSFWSVFASAQMSHEEIRVRTIYSKMAYAVQQEAIGRLAIEAENRTVSVSEEDASLTPQQRLAAVKMDFTLTDFVVGDAQAILSRKVADLITPDWDLIDTLSVTGRSMNYNDNGLETRWNSLEARWQPVDPRPPEARALVEALTLPEIYQIEKKQPVPVGLWRRYASYSVTVTFEGKTRGPYKALILFGTDPEGKPGNESLSVYDILAGSGLSYVISEPLFPDAFVLTHLRNLPIVKNWLDRNEIPPGPHCSISTDKGDVCCDLAELRCGPRSEDVAAGLANPLPDGSLLRLPDGSLLRKEQKKFDAAE